VPVASRPTYVRGLVAVLRKFLDTFGTDIQEFLVQYIFNPLNCRFIDPMTANNVRRVDAVFLSKSSDRA
jgi:hypothetical protein